MNNTESYYLPRWLRSWEQFWFTPADATVLALMRIICGIIIVYTLFAYSFNLQDQMGENAWVDLDLRMEAVRDGPVGLGSLSGVDAKPLPAPVDQFEVDYFNTYRAKWGVPPPPPYPTTQEQVEYLDTFRARFDVDLRAFGLRPPTSEDEKRFVEKFTELTTSIPKSPPSAYPKNAKEEKDIFDYLDRFGQDPRTLYARGGSAFSLWFHVTNPRAMAVLHGVIIFVSVLFTIGFCTRFTAALTWFGNLCYLQRNPTMLFGADTMMLILLLYLMIGPSGAALSVDQLLCGWWAKAKPGWVRWWYALLKRPLPSREGETPAEPQLSAPTISANLAIRLLQVHVCIIYLIAGLAKLQGSAWWQGTALWGTIANYEFAPMNHEWYLDFLRFLGSNQLYLAGFMTICGLFTLAFEISYPFLIWKPKIRWLFLGSALVLHGGIGVFMGLKTFALLMLVMNMVFLRPEEVSWLLSFFTGVPKTDARSERTSEPAAAATSFKK